MKKYFLLALVALLTIQLNAQQVTTLYFLENAPMRHTINPAFQPVSRGYLNFTPLGWSSFGVGNNSLTLSDLVYYDPTTGKTITPLHPDADKKQFIRQIQNMTYFNTDATLGIINMGFRIKEQGFLTIGLNERIEGGLTLPKSLFSFLFDGGMTNLNGINTIGLGGLGLGATMYAELGFGYSYKLNEHWSLGGKVKVLFGHALGGVNSRNLNLNASAQEWNLKGTMDVIVAGPFEMDYLAQYLDGKDINGVINAFSDGSFNPKRLVNYNNWQTMMTPSGYGGAIDFGFAYKPIENLQLSLALTDLGFIYWTKANKYTATVDTTFAGVGDIDYNDPRYQDANGTFCIDSVLSQAVTNLRGLLGGVRLARSGNGLMRMTSARLNVGLDANFWDNRIGLGIVSATRLYNARLYEEVTFGLAFRPVNWFNIAASYSLMNNGKYSNIGAGLSFMPYDGINLTLAMDYIPTSYAALPTKNATDPKKYVLPDKTKMFNLALGFSICWGSNRRDKDHDGVWDKMDMCPNTPRGVKVDEKGCPLDEDHDGIPDYLDQCLGTPAVAIGYVDVNGCALDSDGDGVEDYKDKCPNTPEAAWGQVDSLGCPLDTDGDGVEDYLDQCPDTPKEARGHIDEKGCPKDSDGDGVPDYKDRCPNTPAEAIGFIDAKGCPTDADNDGVPDYLDECPTKKEAIGFVDAKGCNLDSDGDGIDDFEDDCPHVPGIRANKGCPEIKREVRQLLNKAMQGIEFETGKATIKPVSFPILDKIAETFIENENYIIEVQGHTDNVGNEERNIELSEQRAIAVMNYLIAKGVPATRMVAIGYGPSQPIADNNTKAGRAKNRRVAFNVVFEEIYYETILDHADPAPAAEEAPANIEAPATEE